MFERIEKNLRKLYGQSGAKLIIRRLTNLTGKRKKPKPYKIDQKDITLITYANSVTSKKINPINSLDKFCREIQLNKVLSSIHILPFYPWDTDRGFSVKDYYNVDPKYGEWKDIGVLGKKFRLMFDFVANHASIDNPIVQKSLAERHVSPSDPIYKELEPYKNFVIAFNEDQKPSEGDLQNLVRPRPTPVLSPYFVVKNFNKVRSFLGNPKAYIGLKGVVVGRGFVWTTFSREQNKNGTEATRQVDLNFKNPLVFVEAIKILLFYIDKGADLIRLDAIGYIWKKFGSASLHEKEAHLTLEVIHDIVSYLTPNIVTISEVNEPQDKVFEYLGKKGHVESDLVYQFSHFPLAIYGILTGEAGPYVNWLKTIDKFKGRQFITVLGSHDGLGLKPARGLLTDKQIGKLTDILVNKHNALPNLAILPGGKKIIYEICATPFNLINSHDSKEDLDSQIKRYLVVFTLGLTLRGIPGIYFNGIIGAKNHIPKKGLDENRTINRQSFSKDILIKKLKDKKTLQSKIFSAMKRILKVRNSEKIFDPKAPTPEVLDTDNNSVVGLLLTDIKKKTNLLSLINLSSKDEEVKIPRKLKGKKVKDLISGQRITLLEDIILNPYQILWLK